MLLLVKLRELVRKKRAFHTGVSHVGALDAAQRFDISKRELIDAARVHGITEVDEFLRCELFKRSGFFYDERQALISNEF